MNLILTTVSKKNQAQTLARKLVEKKLAACVNIIKIEQSIYHWKGKLQMNGEYQLIIKTSRPYRVLEQFILKNHPYEVPEILHFCIKSGYRTYLNWIVDATR